MTSLGWTHLKFKFSKNETAVLFIDKIGIFDNTDVIGNGSSIMISDFYYRFFIPMFIPSSNQFLSVKFAITLQIFFSDIYSKNETGTI